jgi:signal transduction histidine kinase
VAGVLGLALLAWAMLVRQLATEPWIEAQWRADAHAAVVLESSPLPALAGRSGETLTLVTAPDGERLAPDALLLHTLPRWQVDDARRQSQTHLQQTLAALLARGPVQLSFGDGSAVTLQPAPRGVAGLGLAFWVFSGLAGALLGLGLSVLLVRPQVRNALYLLMVACLAGQLVFLALASLPGLGASLPGPRLALWGPLTLDALVAAAAVHALLLHPRRQARAGLLAAATWALAGGWLGVAWWAWPAGSWAWAQAFALASAGAGWWLAGRSQRIEPNPFAALIQRLTALVGLSMAVVTALVATASLWPDTVGPAATVGAWVWSLVPCALLLLAPFIPRSRQVLRDAALLAGAVAIAAAAHLLFAASLSLGRVGSWVLAAAVGAGLYLLARRWALTHAAANPLLDAERTFEQLYRAARDLQAQPGRYRQLLTQLLRDLFGPREVLPAQRDLAQARVVGGGAALEVPLRGSSRQSPGEPGPTLVLRLADNGRRLFTDDDARLADRVVERLRRAVAYDRAVERGRSEERQRIAQDLHDDIGARLLTLMYQAQTPAMEEYIRLTLKDLKTLTRGLAAGEHRLSHAAAEWKADLAQRLAAAQVQLEWTFSHDRDVPLSMVQWSALTRVLRELVSNVLQHAQATHVGIQISLEGPVLLLRVADDGRGRAPGAWSHGLGLGGVRKRVKLVGGDVAWHEQTPQGIVCEVRVEDFAERGD